ncbi:MAG TPA: ion channel [Saprospiraceae bacterium]|nr:ion channel [Saprospiraceae bacterium]HMQ82412.1 ion channel [Saprospiraceae bacterium]
MRIPSFTNRNSTVADLDNDLGFGNKITDSVDRLINPDGSFNVIRRGGINWQPYQSLVEMSWTKFFIFITIGYILVNALFAILYLIVGAQNLSGIESDAQLHPFWAAFFFSIQTFTTVGYGSVSPMGMAANLIAAFNALVGLMAFALATGLFFSRFSRPKSNIAFSEKAVFRRYHDSEYNSFQLQIVNRRHNKIINLEAQLNLSWIDHRGGNKVRRFATLSLERSKVVLFPLNWVIVHVIDENSPLWQKTREEIEEMEPEFLIMVQGFDETYAQTIHANSSYICEQIHWNARFKPMYYPQAGMTILELGWLHELIRLEE